MIVWLASYPRSGNTLLRMLLRDAFGIESSSFHGGADDETLGHDAVVERVGHVTTSAEGEELVDRLRSTPGQHFVKTHEVHDRPGDPAIYVVRNGKASVVSYWHFLNDFYEEPTSLEDVIEGNVFAGGWSQHYAAWQPQLRPDTLTVRYEDLVDSPAAVTEQVASFLRQEPRRTFSHDFESMRSLNGRFFRSGSNQQNIAELGEHEELFEKVHGWVYRHLGYED